MRSRTIRIHCRILRCGSAFALSRNTILCVAIRNVFCSLDCNWMGSVCTKCQQNALQEVRCKWDRDVCSVSCDQSSTDRK